MHAPCPRLQQQLFGHVAVCGRRVVVHGVQLVLLVALLNSEVIIQQHQLLQRSSFGGGSESAATMPGAAQQQQQQRQHNHSKYQRLAGGEGDVEDGSMGSRRGMPRKPQKLW